MDRLDAMRLFTRIVERHSFTLAAQDLGLPRSTATASIRELEAQLGVRLLQRTTRHVAATAEGDTYYLRCLSILADVEDAESAIGGAAPRGALRVDVHGSVLRHFLAPKLPSFLERYPDIQLHLGEGDRLVDLVREGVDCVLRSGTLRDSSMIVRPIASMDEVTVASPAYLRVHGTPRSLSELAGHRMVGFVSSTTGQVLPLELIVKGKREEVMLPTSVTVNGGETSLALARAGLGLVQAPRYSVEADLHARRLVEVLPKFPPSPTPLSVLFPQARGLSSRVRVFIDWLVSLFPDGRVRQARRRADPRSRRRG
jgi:DNA-binding transcriptional LysR family regulator